MKQILFSAQMVHAIMGGRKTMTRRVIKPQPTFISGSKRWKWAIPKSKVIPDCCESVCDATRSWWEYLMPKQMPYKPGDVLRVKGVVRWDEEENTIGYLDLRVTSVRAERVQDISTEDVIAEGFDGVRCDHPFGRYACEDCYNTGWLEPPQVDFMYTWDTLNTKHKWDSNPWVWVIKFEKCDL